MNQKQFLTSLNKTQRLHFSTKTNRHGLWRLCQQWGLIALLMLAIPLLDSVILRLACMLILGVLLVFQFTLLHETSHRTPFANRRFNDVVGHVCGFILCLPPTWFRLFHLAHHRDTNQPNKDPELASHKPHTRAQHLWHVSGLPIWWGAMKSIWANAWGEIDQDYIPVAKRMSVRREARHYLCGYGLVILLIGFGTLPLLMIWILPILLGQPFLRLYLLAEHADCPHSNNPFENTRTTQTNAVIRWLAWNMPYHAEHHIYPAVPFHRLPELHQRVNQALQVTSQGYIEFNRSYWQKLSSSKRRS